MINELPAPYQSLVDGFTAEALKSRGMTLVTKQTIDFNGSKATIMDLTQSANGTTYLKQMLVFGDPKLLFSLMAFIQNHQKALSRK